MSAPLGFILLTHGGPRQSLRLMDRLNAMFNFPPIVWHHDFSKCALPETKFPPNVSFVRPHVKTNWTEFSVVQAELRAMAQMYERPDAPERFVLLSGADYPIKPARQIIADLQAGDFDGHLDFRRISEEDQSTPHLTTLYRRHICFNFPPAPLFRWMNRRWPMFTRPYRGPFKRLLPFSRELECYAGSQWFVGSRRVAEYILEFHRTKPKLARFYRWTMFPDESYFHTIVMNAESRLKINNNNWRYLDWSECEIHPKTLKMEDLPKLLASPHHFARKFNLEVDAEIFDRLDEFTRA